jgi:hypothetical protein
VGLPRGGSPTPHGDGGDDDTRKPPSLAKHFDRVIDRLSRSAGRTDVPPAILDELGALLQELTCLRESTKGARGSAREQVASSLATLDARLLDAARAATDAGALAALGSAAAGELSGFRDRLVGEAWRQALGATVDRLLRDRYGLPTLTL